MKSVVLLICLTFLSGVCWAARAPVEEMARHPYRSALVVDAATGEVLYEDQADSLVYPASVLKLMDMLIIMEQLEKGTIRLDDLVQVTPEAAKMGGSQVYLDPREKFSVEDLLYALAVQSANDAAVALASHVAGSTEGFVELMNQRAKSLGMKDSIFHSVHGLPPARGQKPDVTTARDLAILGRELAKRQQIFTYTGSIEHPFRQGTFIMRNHNHLLGTVAGCDGFKTGYFRAAGFSIVATAKRNDRRILAIVMGSRDSKTRDSKAAELLARGFVLASSKKTAAPATETVEPDVKMEHLVVQTEEKEVVTLNEKREKIPSGNRDWGMFFLGLGTGVMLSGLPAIFFVRKRRQGYSGYRSYR